MMTDRSTKNLTIGFLQIKKLFPFHSVKDLKVKDCSDDAQLMKEHQKDA